MSYQGGGGGGGGGWFITGLHFLYEIWYDVCVPLHVHLRRE